MSERNGFNSRLIAEFRASGGVVRGQFAGAELMILTTTGAKSGLPRETPLAFTKDGDAWVIIASKGGAPNNPSWYHNLIANPEAWIEVGGESIPVSATEAKGAERDRLFNAMATKMSGFAEYQRNTTRVIPVFTLERRALSSFCEQH